MHRLALDRGQSLGPQPARTALRIHSPEPSPPADRPEEGAIAINGFPSTLLVWTAEQWARLERIPLDLAVVTMPSGLRVALRVG